MGDAEPRTSYADVESTRLTTEGQLQDVAERLEAIDWREVPGVTTVDAAVFVSRLEEARERL